MSGLRSGSLNRRIDLKTFLGTVDSYGEAAESETDDWKYLNNGQSVPAMVVPVRGSESFSSQRELGRRIAKFTIRYRTDVTIEDKIVFESKDWDILSIAEIGLRNGLELLAETLI